MRFLFVTSGICRRLPSPCSSRSTSCLKLGLGPISPTTGLAPARTAHMSRALSDRHASRADLDSSVLQFRVSLLAEQAGGGKALCRLSFGPDRCQQLLRAGRGGRHQLVRSALRRCIGNRGRRPGRSAGDAAGRARGESLEELVRTRLNMSRKKLRK